MKCAPQVLGLVMGEPKQGQKHRANGRKIFEEFGNERYTTSETIDRSRSRLNVYDGFTSGGEAWDSMCETARSYRVKCKMKNGKSSERALRSDAVIGYAVIFNPPHDMCVEWTDEEYEKFYSDSWDVLCEIQPHLFRPSMDNAVMSAEHFDEDKDSERDGKYTRHAHVGGNAVDEDGRYCGNLIDAKLCADINLNYPRLMRERGWDLEDLDVTDFSRMGKNKDGTYKDPKYRMQRLAKKAGLSVNEYILAKRDRDLTEREADAEKREEKLAKREAGLEEHRVKYNDAVRAFRKKQEAHKNNEAALDAREARLKAQEATLRRETEKFMLEKQKWQNKASDALEEVSDLLFDCKGLQDDVEKKLSEREKSAFNSTFAELERRKRLLNSEVTALQGSASSYENTFIF